MFQGGASTRLDKLEVLLGSVLAHFHEGGGPPLENVVEKQKGGAAAPPQTPEVGGEAHSKEDTVPRAYKPPPRRPSSSAGGSSISKTEETSSKTKSTRMASVSMPPHQDQALDRSKIPEKNSPRLDGNSLEKKNPIGEKKKGKDRAPPGEDIISSGESSGLDLSQNARRGKKKGKPSRLDIIPPKRVVHPRDEFESGSVVSSRNPSEREKRKGGSESHWSPDRVREWGEESARRGGPAHGRRYGDSEDGRAFPKHERPGTPPCPRDPQGASHRAKTRKPAYPEGGRWVKVDDENFIVDEWHEAHEGGWDYPTEEEDADSRHPPSRRSRRTPSSAPPSDGDTPSVGKREKFVPLQIQPPRKLQIAKGGLTPLDFTLPTPVGGGGSVSSHGGGRVANVNRIENASGPQIVAMANPMVASVLQGVSMGKFSGKPEHLHKFVKDWERYIKMWSEAYPMTNQMILAKLQEHLDRPSAAILEALMGANPDLTYEEFWDDFLRRHMRDGRNVHLKNWKNCKLRAEDPEHPTQGEWAQFQVEFKALRELVDTWTEADELDIIIPQTPQWLLEKVRKKTAKERDHRFWVRVGVPGDVDPRRLQEQLEALIQMRFPRVVHDFRHFVVKGLREGEQKRLLAQNGAELDGYRIKIEMAQYFMKGNEVLDFVWKCLRDEEDVKAQYEAFHPQPSVHFREKKEEKEKEHRGYGVHSVEDTPRPNLASSSGGRGRSRSPQDKGWTSVNETSERGKGKGGKGGASAPSPSSREPWGARRDSSNEARRGQANEVHNPSRNDGKWQVVMAPQSGGKAGKGGKGGNGPQEGKGKGGYSQDLYKGMPWDERVRRFGWWCHVCGVAGRAFDHDFRQCPFKPVRNGPQTKPSSPSQPPRAPEVPPTQAPAAQPPGPQRPTQA